MNETRQAWEQVGDHLSGLGLKMKYHLEQELSDDDGEKVVSALKRLGDAIEDTVDAIGNAAKDPAVKDDVKSFGRSFVSALSVTVEDASDRVRDVIDRNKAGEESSPPPPTPDDAGSETPAEAAPAADEGGPTPPKPSSDASDVADDLSDD